MWAGRGGMVSLITDKLGRQTLQDVDQEPLLPEVLSVDSAITPLPTRRTVDGQTDTLCRWSERQMASLHYVT